MFYLLLKQNGKTLIVPNVQEDDLGRYVCEVRNGIDAAHSFRIELREDGKKRCMFVFVHLCFRANMCMFILKGKSCKIKTFHVPL